MKTIFCVLAFALALLLPGASWAQSYWPDHYDGSRAIGTWTTPTAPINQAGTLVGDNPVWQVKTGGLATDRTVLAELLDRRPLSLTAERFASNAVIFAAVKRLGLGPYGLAASIALPAVADWIAGDLAAHIRKAPDGQGVEKKDPNSCVSNCRVYSWDWSKDSGFYSVSDACAAFALRNYSGNRYTCTNGSQAQTLVITDFVSGAAVGTTWGSVSSQTTPPHDLGWLPASMDDIAPYMTPRVPSVDLPVELVQAGEHIDVVPGPANITTTTPAAQSPYSETTAYPAPAAGVTTSTVLGNPFSLAPDTPTVTSTSNGTASVNPGNMTSTGTNPTGQALPAPAPLSLPTHTTVTSVYNATTNITTNTTTVTQDAGQSVTTVTPTTTITNTTSTSTVINNYSKTTITTNVTNSTVINNFTDNRPPPPPPDATKDASKSLCELFPDILACAKLGEPPGADPLRKETTAVTVTPITFAGGGGCPAPVTFTAYGVHEFSYQALCDKLIYLKVLFLAIAGFFAAYILADSFKVT